VALEGGATAQPVSLSRVASAIDPRAGSLKFTGEALHIAIEGEGFFEVATAAGAAYTRQGQFHVDPRGRLVTESGDAVMGKSGEIVLQGARPVIDRDGSVTDNGRVVGRLKIVRLPAAKALERSGNGQLRVGGGEPVTEVDGTVRQGYAENSNVNAMTEMVRLIETTRHFEATQKLVQGYDEMLEKALRKLGDL
jgi:flagellar basal-body rod protein FlgG